jgi:multidrug efflux pump subunit AcrB
MSARARIWCAASSRSRWNAPSRPPTALITWNRASKLGLSTITVHLRLNYDSKKALGEINSKVDQVRNDLPPEAEIPTLSIVTADSQFASAYLSFSSDILEANQITDYLTRIVQPRLTALEGVQKADILGGRTFAMRIWLKPDRLAAFNISPNQIRQALAANNFLSAVGHTKGSLVEVNLTANTDLRSVDEFKNLVVRQNGDQLVRLSDVADVVLGAEDYDSEVRFSGERAVFMGIWGFAERQFARCHQARAQGNGFHPKRPADRPHGARRLRRDEIYFRRIARSDQDARQTLIIVSS